MIGALLGVFISITTFAQGPSKEGPSALSDLFYKAETYRITGRTELAKEAYTLLLAQDPVHETALYQLARLWFTESNSLKPSSSSPQEPPTIQKPMDVAPAGSQCSTGGGYGDRAQFV